jgi:acyl transferase domain-containing protein/pimeloyl-ACP methyl ester carboxylesterase
MAAEGDAAGTMASLACPRETAETLVASVGGYVVVANVNSPRQTVISGERASVEAVVRLAEAEDIKAVQLAVSNAFHSELVSDAAAQLRERAPIAGALAELEVAIFSSTTGERVDPGLDLREHFASQVTTRVDFVSLIERLSAECDLLLEVGPGRVLTGLTRAIVDEAGPPCLPVASEPGADRDLNAALGELFVRGAEIAWSELYAGRLVRPFTPASELLFIENQLERPFGAFGPVEPAAADLGAAGDGQPAPALAAAAGLTGTEMSDYLQRRGRFLADVIRADLGTPALEHGQRAAVEPEEAAEPVPAAAPASAAAIEARLIALVAEQTGFPADGIAGDARLLDDLNLDSIKAAELVTAAAQEHRVELPDPSEFANATLNEVAQALAAAASAGAAGQSAAAPHGPAGVDALAGRPSWVRNFVIEHVERPLPPAEPATLAGANVVILSEPRDLDVAEAIAAACRARGGAVRTAAFAEADVVDSGLFSHIVAVLPRAADPEAPPATAVQRALGRLRGVAAPAAQPRHGRGQTTLVYLQSGGGLGDPARPADAIEQCCAAAFAASVHHERPDLKVRVIDTAPALDARALGECVVAEIATPEPFVLAGYDAELTRRVPSPRPIEAADLAPRAIAWSPDDVVLVTGGAKGITAECALGLARSTGARMALAGSSPGPGERDTDGAVGRTLERFASAGLTARYYRCDVTDPAAVQNLVERVRGELGPVTGVVHGAGSNTPKRVEQASVEQARREVAPKVLGILNLCAALEGAPPKLIVGLSSITAVTGMPGNAWYGFANEALELTVRQFAARHPETAAQSIAFSVWDEVGMGARLGVVQTLADMGVAPIPADEGVRRFLELIHHDAGAGRVVVAARLRGLDTWAPEAPELPAAARYLEDVIHLEPGVEVVARAELTLERDGYLRDHVYKGTHLLPTTFGLEAMAQAAAYVLGERTLGAVRIEDIRLERPIPVDPADGTRIEVRAEALERRAPDDPRRVRAAIGVESSGFATDHFSAVFVLDAVTDAPAADVESAPEPLSIDPRADLYGGLLFQGPRFQRLESIHRLDSEGCVFRAHQTDERLILGDPYFRDALLQAPQLMVPQSLCLPVAIDALELFGDPEGRSGSRVCVARRERDQDGYERSQVLALDDDGRVMERLTGYRTRILERREDHPTAAELADPGERDAKLLDDRLSELGECFGVEVPVASLVYLPGLHALSREERHRLELPVLERTAGTAVTWLESGKPVVAGDGGGLDVSVAHDEQACLCVAGIAPQGCDIAPEVHRSSEEWAALLGGARVPVLEELVGMGGAEVHDRAGTRIWAAVEAVRKAVGGEGPIELALERRTGDGVLFRGGRPGTQLHVLTFPLGLSRGPERLVAVVIPAPGPTPDPAPRAPAAHLTREGGGPPVVFVHGSIVGAVTWAAQQPLAARWSNLVLERRGFGDSPPADREDFEVDARDIVEALGDGAHLVAHSYGAIGAVLAATARPELVRSLTLVEPVAHAIATDHPAVQRGLLDLIGLFTSGPREPREFLVEFLGLIGLPSELPEQLPRGMEHTTRLLMNSNPPFAARLRLDDLARHGLRTLVVSGGHSEVFDAICDRLEERLDAERAVIPGALHAVPATGEPFNERLERFLSASGTVKDR